MKIRKSNGETASRKGAGMQLSGAQPLERSVLSQQVCKEVMKGLLNGRLLPGDRLVENDLANLLGVSRSPIREALAELAQGGVVVREMGRGSRVREWTKRDLEELFGIRSVLEGYASRLVAGKIDEKSHKAFERIIARMRTAAVREDYAAMIELDLEFHALLWQLTGNTLLQNTLQGLSQQFRLFLTMNWRFHGGLSNVADSHTRLLEALAQPDPALAEETIRKHVVVEKMVSALAGPERTSPAKGREKRVAA